MRCLFILKKVFKCTGFVLFTNILKYICTHLSFIFHFVSYKQALVFFLIWREGELFVFSFVICLVLKVSQVIRLKDQKYCQLLVTRPVLVIKFRQQISVEMFYLRLVHFLNHLFKSSHWNSIEHKKENTAIKIKQKDYFSLLWSNFISQNLIIWFRLNRHLTLCMLSEKGKRKQ